MSPKFSFLRALATLAHLQYTLANPVSTPREEAPTLVRRANPCEPGGSPQYYQEYHGDLCPPKKIMDKDGQCPSDDGDHCIAYCEVRQEFTYDQEKPIDNSYCFGPETCTVSTNKATTYTWNGNINIKWAEALGIGITGGYSKADATTDIRSTSVNLKEGDCGYFTFLPVIHHSCGSVTEATRKQLPCPISICPPPYCVDPKTYGNICTSQPHRSSDGKLVLGDTIFVKTNCADHGRLPMESQVPAYQHPGVAAPQSVIEGFLATQQDQNRCVLSDECQHPDGYAINAACTCKCDGEPASLHEPGCSGFKGSLPDPPAGGPPNGP